MSYMEYIITKQCEAIGIPRDAVDPYNKDKQWSQEHSWTREMRDAFVDWLSHELYTNKKLRNGSMYNPRKNKKACRKCAELWDFIYGWEVVT